MKWLVVMLCAGVLAWAGYQWLNDRMIQERIGAAVEQAIDEPRTRTTEQMRAEILQAARQQGVALDSSAIVIAATPTNHPSLAGHLVSAAGVPTTTRRLTARVTYGRRVWGRLRSHVVERSKLYVAAASPASGPQDTLLQQLP